MNEVAIKEAKVKKLWIARICLWIGAAAATFYWIAYSFHLYDIQVFDVHEYAYYFRPVFGVCLLISVSLIIISLLLRRKSDQLKKEIKEYECSIK